MKKVVNNFNGILSLSGCGWIAACLIRSVLENHLRFMINISRISMKIFFLAKLDDPPSLFKFTFPLISACFSHGIQIIFLFTVCCFVPFFILSKNDFLLKTIRRYEYLINDGDDEVNYISLKIWLWKFNTLFLLDVGKLWKLIKKIFTLYSRHILMLHARWDRRKAKINISKKIFQKIRAKYCVSFRDFGRCQGRVTELFHYEDLITNAREILEKENIFFSLGMLLFFTE